LQGIKRPQGGGGLAYKKNPETIGGGLKIKRRETLPNSTIFEGGENKNEGGNNGDLDQKVFDRLPRDQREITREGSGQ